MIGITNASPLIYLGKIGALDLLHSVFEKIITSEEVVHEVLDKGSSFEIPAIQKFLSSYVSIQKPLNPKFVDRLKTLNLHPGEASIIALSYEMKNLENAPLLIIDDLGARKVVVSLNLPLTGTIGVILRATQSTMVSSIEAQKLLDTLVLRTDFHISTSLYVRVKNILQNLKG